VVKMRIVILWSDDKEDADVVVSLSNTKVSGSALLPKKLVGSWIVHLIKKYRRIK
jgi:hypothetical protein